MAEEQKRYSVEFKLAAVKRMEGCGNVSALADELGIRRKFLYQWRDVMRRQGEAGLARGPGRPRGSGRAGAVPRPAESSAQARIAELERLLGRKQAELEFFKQAFEHVRGLGASTTRSGAGASTRPSRRATRSKED